MINSYNKEILNIEANRYFFIEKPVKVKIADAPKRKVELSLHPNYGRGIRKFNTHQEFYVGTTNIENSTCPSTATFVNDTAQDLAEDALFQEILLTDTNSLIYTTIIHDQEQGFNFQNYDFQMIVAEKDLPGEQATPYYFWVELA